MNNYVIVSASTREESQSARVAKAIHTLLATVDSNACGEIIDLSITHHQEWSSDFWGETIPCSVWRDTSRKLGCVP